MAKLTALGVKNLVTPGRHTDGEGLHLHVRSAQRRMWVFRYMRQGKTRDLGLGQYPDVSLADARNAAAAARALLSAGKDPVEARRAEEAARAEAEQHATERTFRRAAEDLIASKSSGWKNEKHKAQWPATLEAYAYPTLGDMAVTEIDTAHVLKVLQPIWNEKTETASRLRGRIEAVLDAAKVNGWRAGENPARWKGHLASILPPVAKTKRVEHHPALPWARIGDFMEALRKRTGSAARCLEFAILTAARSGEARGVTWREIDTQAGIWTVPAARMKAGREHRVPLTTQAIAVLKQMLPEHRRPEELVFPGMKDKAPLSDMSLTAVIRRMNDVKPGEPVPWTDQRGAPIVVHGFRSAFRDWAEDTGIYAGRIAEAALAHVVGDATVAAYQRGDLFDRRREMMAAWASLCDRPTASNVAELRRKGTA